ncbi:MAG TPA: lysoplasmalogenase [Anaerolineales bacterium]
MSFTLLGVSLFVALIDWIAVATKLKRLEYFAKPGVMLVLLIWIWNLDGLSGPMVWFALGAMFSLAGDVFLMLPNENFRGGLLAFLLAHAAYIIGLNQVFPPVNLASLVLLIIISLTAVSLYRRIANALPTIEESQMRLPILAYTLVISVMLLSALITMVRPDNHWTPYASLLVSAGALLFFISDAVLAWNRFVTTLTNARLKVIIPYHLGQIGILLGAALHFMK